MRAYRRAGPGEPARRSSRDLALGARATARIYICRRVRGRIAIAVGLLCLIAAPAASADDAGWVRKALGAPVRAGERRRAAQRAVGLHPQLLQQRRGDGRDALQPRPQPVDRDPRPARRGRAQPGDRHPPVHEPAGPARGAPRAGGVPRPRRERGPRGLHHREAAGGGAARGARLAGPPPGPGAPALPRVPPRVAGGLRGGRRLDRGDARRPRPPPGGTRRAAARRCRWTSPATRCGPPASRW